jgi:hypothetical protein
MGARATDKPRLRLLCFSFWVPFVLTVLTGRGQAASDRFVWSRGDAEVEAAGEHFEDKLPVLRLSGLLRVTLRLTGPATLEVESPRSPNLSETWKVHQIEPPTRNSQGANRVRWEQTIVLSPLKPGKSEVQLRAFRKRESPEQPWQEVNWPPIPAQVTTVIATPDLKELREPSGPEELPPLPPPDRRWVWVVVGLVLLGLFGVAIRGALRHLRRRPVLTPEQRALAALDGLTVPETDAGGAVDWFHIRLSDLMRRYLEERYQLRAPRQTTAEFLAALRMEPCLNDAQQGLLQDFLERCDLAKFAGVAPPAEECRHTLELARRFIVEGAQPVPTPAPVPTPE